jgi:hypothetical protein
MAAQQALIPSLPERHVVWCRRLGCGCRSPRPPDRFGVGDPAVGEQTIGSRWTDPRYDQEQLTHLHRLSAGRRVGDPPALWDAAGGDLSPQLRACDANLVCLRRRAQPLLGRPSRRLRGLRSPPAAADSTTSRARPRRGDFPSGVEDAGSDDPAGLVVPSIGDSSPGKKSSRARIPDRTGFDLIVRARPS